MKEKVILGLSGGVDSAVAAMILREQNYDVIGVYLDNGLPGADDAQKAADSLNIPLVIRDTRNDMEQAVYRPFAEAYLHGETPNPCILCNPAVKFRILQEEADRFGGRYIATGHYAQCKNGQLYRGASENDQSYMLCRLSQKQILNLLLPLGPYRKSEVREMAVKADLSPAKKPDSMEICFIPDNDYAAWLERRGCCRPAGKFVMDGKTVGYHRGIHHFTIGQRKHLGQGFGQKVYVSDILPESDSVVLSADESNLFKAAFSVRDISWIAPPAEDIIECGIRIRHSRSPMPIGKVEITGKDARISFEEAVRAPTPGQTAAFYQGNLLLGGGFITK